jgi:leucyl aminopeptidase
VSVQVRVVGDQPWTTKADVLVVPIVGPAVFEGPLGEIDRRTGGELTALQAFGELREKQFTSSISAPGGLPVGRVVTISVGTAADVDRETVLRLGASAIHRLAGRHATSVAIWIGPLISALGGDAVTVSRLVARGAVEGDYEPRAMYRSRDEVALAPPEITDLTLITGDHQVDVSACTKAAQEGVIVGEGTNLARSLANRSANDVTPEVLAEEAYGLAKKHGLWIDVIGPEKATDLGMGMFMAVGKGSDNPPRMIVMRSGKEGEKDALGRHLAIVGKGVCFDSGGISLKPGDRMEEMKMDKAGACSVIAAMATVARLAPGTPLLGLAPAVENMPGPHSTRPGDIVTALNGKKVDIINTDAEGRLILGDALTYAERLGATHLVDVATLTGLVVRALGDQMAGAFGTPDAWRDSVVAAGAAAGERFWPLPMVEDYKTEMESWYGDVTNSGSADGSLVKSALFIREFTTVPWVHLDIAGTAYYRKTKPYAPRGATGSAHATLVELALAGSKPA